MATRSGGPILELFAVPDLYTSGALEIEHLDGNVRVTFYVERRSGVSDELPARVPIAALVMAVEDCTRIGYEMQQAGQDRPGVTVRYPMMFRKN